MTTVMWTGPFRLFFFSNERSELPHIHVEAAEKYAKFWLEPVSIAGSSNFGGHELTELGRIIDENSDFLKERWHEFFNR